LEFIRNFNQKIEENILPNGLKCLYLSSSFNQEIEKNVLPNSLTHLYFGKSFEMKLDENNLPTNLIKLSFFDKDKYPYLHLLSSFMNIIV
jgi:hypothetical protein